MAASPPASPSPPELGLITPNASAALMLAVTIALAVSALSRSELWQPLPPHFVHAAWLAWRAYNSALKSRPRLTSVISGAVISGLGNRIGTGEFGVTTLHFMLWGALVNCISSVWVPIMNSVFAGSKSRWVAVKRTIADQLIMTPLFTALFQVVHGTLQGVSPEDTWTKLCIVFPSACMKAWRFWPPIALVAYTAVPPQLLVVFFSFASLVWNVILTLMHSTRR